MPHKKLKEQLINQKIIKRKDKLSILRVDWKYPADVYINGKRIGTAHYNGREYSFKKIYKSKRKTMQKPFTIGHKMGGRK